MKVTATQQGFFGQFRDPGMSFEIPDVPTRKLTKEDDALTRAIAVKNQVPCAFASIWMRPAGDSTPLADPPVQSHLIKTEGSEALKGSTDDAIDLNADVI